MCRFFSNCSPWVAAILFLSVSSFGGISHAQDHVRAIIDSLDPFKGDEKLSGKIRIAGSGSMANLVEMWHSSLAAQKIEIAVEVAGGGSEEGLKKLAAKEIDLATVSRPLSKEDIEVLKKAGLKSPVAVVVGIDPLAVFVHETNPVKSVTPEDIQKIYSDASPLGKFDQWGQLGLAGDFEKLTINLHDRGESSGTQTFTVKYLLSGHPMRTSAVKHDSNAAMVDAVVKDVGGITIAPYQLRSKKVKMLPLHLGEELVEANEESILSGAYPLVRPLCLVFDREGDKATVALLKGFINFALSREGQLDSIKAGYFPLNHAQVHQQQDLIGVEVLR